MTEAPLRANPEDRPLPPSGGISPGSPSGGAPAGPPPPSGTSASPPTGGAPAGSAAAGAPEGTPIAGPPAPAKSPAAPAVAPQQPPAKPAAAHTRPIGRVAPARRDWRSAWSGFLIGVATLAAAIGLAWLLWHLAGGQQTAQAPAERPTPVDLAEIEALLDGLGFPPGKIDGVIDADSSAAIRDFQTTAGLTADGAPSSALLEELRAAQLELTGGQ